MSRVIIQVQGGLVQDVFIMGLGAPKSYVFVDHDCEGSDDYIEVKGKDGGCACVSQRKISRLPGICFVRKIVGIFDSRSEK